MPSLARMPLLLPSAAMTYRALTRSSWPVSR